MIKYFFFLLILSGCSHDSEFNKEEQFEEIHKRFNDMNRTFENNTPGAYT